MKENKAYNFKSLSHFFSYVSDQFISPEKPLNIFILLPEKRVSVSTISEIAKRKKIYFDIIEEGRDICTLEIGVRTKQIEGYLIILDKFWLLTTFTEASRSRQSLNSVLRRLSPLISLGYLPSSILLDFVYSIRKKYDRITLHESFLRTEYQTARRWRKKYKDFDGELLSKMKAEQGKWVAITFKAYFKDFMKFHVRVYEDGQMTFYSGDFQDFYSSALLPYAVYCRKINNNLSDRQREIKNNKVILHPITFRLTKSLDKSDLCALSDRMLTQYSGGVFSSGNPMLIMTIIDNNDGSAFDIYARDKRIDVVPLTKASSSSLSDLCRIITDFLPDISFETQME